jgi:hypothetical protein
MDIELSLVAGNDQRQPSKKDVQRNIDALQRCIDGKKLCSDDTLLIDTISILEAIQDRV